MIATTRRMAMTDFLLIASASTVIALSFWPAKSPRQLIEIRDRTGNLQRYSVPTNNPKLALLRQQLDEKNQRGPNRAIAMARWRAEVAEFYAQRTAIHSDDSITLAPVSFIDRAGEFTQPAETAEAIARRAEHDHWVRAAELARARLAEAELQISQRSSLDSRPPIVMGEIVPSPLDRLSLAASAVIGLFTACMFAFWTYVCPRIRLQTASTSSTPQFAAKSARHNEKCLRLVLPESWVRVTQPASVQLRRGAFAAIVLAALVCVVL